MQMTYDNNAQMYNGRGNCVYAGFFIRLAAYIIDLLIINLLLLVIKIPVGVIQLMAGDNILFSPVLFQYNIFDVMYYLCTVAYFVISTYLYGNTLGKYLLGIKVVSSDGQKLDFVSVLIRETVGRYLSAIIIYIGYIFVGVDSRKQSLHDKIADTYVVFRNTSQMPRNMVQYR